LPQRAGAEGAYFYSSIVSKRGRDLSSAKTGNLWKRKNSWQAPIMSGKEKRKPSDRSKMGRRGETLTLSLFRKKDGSRWPTLCSSTGKGGSGNIFVFTKEGGSARRCVSTFEQPGRKKRIEKKGEKDLPLAMKKEKKILEERGGELVYIIFQGKKGGSTFLLQRFLD